VQLLVCSDSPWRTPQNLSDPYLRTLRNEPSNLPSVVAAVAEAMAGLGARPWQVDLVAVPVATALLEREPREIPAPEEPDSEPAVD
jgi:hypothetical protein